MSLSAAVLDALVATGATQEQLVAAMKADIADREAQEAARLEAKREGNRLRQQRKRAKSRPVTHVTRDERDVPPIEDILTPSEVSEAEASSTKPAKFILPADIPAEPWAGYEEMRIKIGHRMTDRAKKLAVNELRKLAEDGWPPGDVLNHCTLNSYRGIYPPKDRQNGRPTNSLGRHQPDDGLSPTTRAARDVFGLGASH